MLHSGDVYYLHCTGVLHPALHPVISTACLHCVCVDCLHCRFLAVTWLALWRRQMAAVRWGATAGTRQQQSTCRQSTVLGRSSGAVSRPGRDTRPAQSFASTHVWGGACMVPCWCCIAARHQPQWCMVHGKGVGRQPLQGLHERAVHCASGCSAQLLTGVQQLLLHVNSVAG